MAEKINAKTNQILNVLQYNKEYVPTHGANIYEDFLTTLINNTVLVYDRMDGDVKSEFNFAPATWVFAGLQLTLTTFSLENKLVDGKETVEKYLQHLAESNSADFFLGLFLEIKEFKAYLESTQKQIDFNAISNDLINWYQTKSNEQQYILTFADLCLRALFRPRFNVAQAFADPDPQIVKEINVFATLFTKNTRNE